MTGYKNIYCKQKPKWTIGFAADVASAAAAAICHGPTTFNVLKLTHTYMHTHKKSEERLSVTVCETHNHLVFSVN